MAEQFSNEQKLNKVIEYLKSGDKTSAKIILEEILRIDPDNANAIYFSALIHIDNREFVKARGLAMRGIELAPCYELFTVVGDSYYNEQAYAEALPYYQKALKYKPDSAEIHFLTGTIYQQLSNFEDAKNAYLSTLQLNPKHESAYAHLGNLFTGKNMLAEALNCYEKALNINPKSHVYYFNIANIFKKAGQDKKAIEFYLKSLEIKPNDAEAYEMLGNCYRNLNDIQNAIDALLKSLELNPDKPSVHAELGNISYSIGRPDLAKNYYDNLKRLAPDSMEFYVRAGNEVRYDYWIHNRDRRVSYSCADVSVKFAVAYFYGDSLDTSQYDKFLSEMKAQKFNNFDVFPVKNTENDLLQKLTDEYTHVCFVEQGDSLHHDALCALADRISTNPDTEIIYTDEDIKDGEKRLNPHFKTEFAEFLLLSQNYMNALLCLKLNSQSINAIKQNKEINQKALYKIVLDLTKLTGKIYRIPDVLYHRAPENQKTLENTSHKELIEEQIKKKGYKANLLEFQPRGINVIKFLNRTNPRISIIIPFKDKLDYTKRCIESIEKNSTYKNYEIILINNRSEQQETLEFLERTRHKVVDADIPFNFAQINNMGVEVADGEYFLFMNNDMSIISPDWIETTLALAEMPKVGLVGAKLLFDDNFYQHIGLIKKTRIRQTFHINGRQDSNTPSYRYYADVVREYSCLTGAFLMISREKFNEIGGFDEEFLIEKNDIDLCLKTIKAGYINLYNPHAALYHYESVSRKNSGHISKEAEKYFQEKWDSEMAKPDPYYNPNLSDLFNNYIVALERNLIKS